MNIMKALTNEILGVYIDNSVVILPVFYYV